MDIAGLVVGVVAGVVTIGGTIFAIGRWFHSRRRPKDEPGRPPPDQPPSPAPAPQPINVTLNVPGLGGGASGTQSAAAPSPVQITVNVTYTWEGRPASLGNRFVGREDELEAIGEAFTRSRAVVLAGGAGAGKSRLAAEYSHGASQPGFWTAAGETVEGTMAALAPQLGVLVEGREVNEVAGEVSRTLAALDDEPMWVIDNLSDIADCGRLLDAAGHARVLFTTRDLRSEELRGSAEFVEVEPLEEDASVQLLRSAGYNDDDEDVLRGIAVAVGHLPLALEMLAVRLAKPPRDAGAVLAVVREAPDELEEFKRAAGFDEHHAAGVFATIAGTLEALPAAVRQQIASLGYIAEDPLPFPLLQALAGVDEEGLRELLEACRRESVLAVLDDGSTVRLHALTIAAVAATNPTGALEDATMRATDRLRSLSRAKPAELRIELRHYESMYAVAVASISDEARVSMNLTNALSETYLTLGLVSDRIRIDEEAVRACEQVLGPEHPNTLSSKNNLAGGYGFAGRTRDAIQLHEETLPIRERVLGLEHPNTLSSRTNLAMVYLDAGRTEDAIRLGEQTLKIIERVFGPEHLETFASRNILATGYGVIGRTEDAIRLNEETLEIMERTLGPEHLDTLSSKTILAVVYLDAGRTEDAIRLNEETLEIRQRVLGPGHLHTLASRTNLAAGYDAAGRAEDAIRLNEETLKALVRLVGPQHPHTLGSRNNLANCYRAAGRMREAIDLDEETLAIRERVLGAEHPDTLSSRKNLAIGYVAVGRSEDAERLLAELPDPEGPA